MTVRSLLVVTQVALSLVLLVSAGLLLRTVGNLRGVDVGFTSGRMLLATVDLGAAGYDRPRGLAFCATLVERLRALPGVEAVSLARVAPVAGGGSRTTVAIPGYRPGPDEDMEINFNAVDAGYFRTLGIRLVRGRPFSGADGAASPLVAIVNETMARRHWAGQDPVGRMMGFGERGPFNVQVVGVAPDAKYRTLREEPGPSFYLPLAQMYSGELTLHARTASSGSAFPSLLRHELAALDSRLALSNIRTLDDQLDRAISRERVAANLLTAFGVLALVLSAVGLAGLMAYNVAQRTREFGVRLALGASPLEIRHIVLRRGLALVAAGAIVGAAGSVAATRAIAALLYGVRPFDAMTIAATAALLGGVALLACDVPARRAARLDPVAALRTE
jgi:predicted permease